MADLTISLKSSEITLTDEGVRSSEIALMAEVKSPNTEGDVILLMDSASTSAVNNSEQPEKVGVETIPNLNDVMNNNDGDKKLSVLRKVSEYMHCPFYWQADLHIKTYGDHEIDLLSEFEEMFEDSSFTFRRFVIQLVMSYHNFYKRLVEKSLQNIDEMERMLCNSARKPCPNPLFNRIKDALFHVSHNCLVYILEITNQVERTFHILEKITPYNSMNKENQAGIWGIRAAVYAEYGYEGIKHAIEYASTAIELDRENEFWHFFKGLYLGRLRRMEKASIIPDEEILCLEEAISIREDPAFYAFTAESYLEMVKATERKQRMKQLPMNDIMKEFLNRYTLKAAEYFEKSIKMKENCAHLLFRCGKGFMRLPPPHQDLKKAKACLQKGLKISPKSSYGNHAMAMFMISHEKNDEAAEPYLELAVERNNFQAHIDLCRKMYFQDQKSLIPELEKLLEIYNENPKICKIYGELICCHLFLDYDLVKACNYGKNLMELQNTWIDYIYEFNSKIFPFPRSLPLIELLTAEINKLWHDKRTTDVQRNAYKSFHHFIYNEKVKTSNDTPRNILQVYMEELNQGLRKQRQLVGENIRGKNEKTQARERNRITENTKHSGDNEYRKYYNTNENRSLGDVLPPVPSEQPKRGYRRRTRRHSSGSSSGSSTSSREKTKNVTKVFASLTVKETQNSSQSKPTVPTEEMSVDEKMTAFLSNMKEKGCDISYRPAIKVSDNKSEKIANTNSAKNDENCSSFSVSNRRQQQPSSPSPERKSSRTTHKHDYRDTSSDSDARCSKSYRSEKKYASSKEKSVRRSDRGRRSSIVDKRSVRSNSNISRKSRRRNDHIHERSSRSSIDSGSSSSIESRNNRKRNKDRHRRQSSDGRTSSKRSHSSNDKRSLRSNSRTSSRKSKGRNDVHERSSSVDSRSSSSVESKNIRKHNKGRHRKQSHDGRCSSKRSHSSKRSRQHYDGGSSHKSRKSRDHSYDRYHERKHSRRRRDYSDTDVSSKSHGRHRRRNNRSRSSSSSRSSKSDGSHGYRSSKRSTRSQSSYASSRHHRSGKNGRESDRSKRSRMRDYDHYSEKKYSRRRLDDREDGSNTDSSSSSGSTMRSRPSRR